MHSILSRVPLTILSFLLVLGHAFPVNSLGARATDSVTVSIRSETLTVYKQQITIADIAEVQSNNAALKTKIEQLDLDALETLPANTTVSKNQIRIRMMLAGIDDDSLFIQGPDTIAIRAMNRNDLDHVIQQKIIDEVAKQFAVERDSLRVSLQIPEKTSNLSELANSIDQAFVVFGPELPHGPTQVRFDYPTSSSAFESLNINCRVIVMKELLLAKHHIRRGSTITKHDLSRVTRPLDNPKIITVGYEESLGKAAATDIAQHTILRASHIVDAKKQPLVRRNDLVDIVLKRNGLEFRRSNAKVLTQGSMGDSVQVETPNNKRLTATVVSKTLVEIQ